MEAYVGVEACLSTIEREERLAAAAVVAANAMLASRIGHHDAAEAWFNLAIERARDPESKAALVYRSSLDLVRRGRIDVIPRLEEYAGLDTSLAAALNATLATAYVIADRPNDAMRRAYQARDILASERLSSQRPRTLYQIAFVALRTGEIHNAKTFAHEAVESARRDNDYDIAARGYSLLYELAYSLECDPRAALRYVEMVENYAKRSGDAHVRAWATMAALYIEVEAGNLSGARERELALSAADLVQSAEITSETLVPAQALRSAWRRDFAKAYRLVAESGESQATNDRRAHRFAEAALYAAAAGSVEEARTAIESAEWMLSSQVFKQKAHIETLAYTTLASALATGIESAEPRRARLLAWRDEVPPAMVALIDAVDAVFRNWQGAGNHEELLRAFEALRTHYLGGISMLFEALPMPQ